MKNNIFSTNVNNINDKQSSKYNNISEFNPQNLNIKNESSKFNSSLNNHKIKKITEKECNDLKILVKKSVDDINELFNLKIFNNINKNSNNSMTDNFDKKELKNISKQKSSSNSKINFNFNIHNLINVQNRNNNNKIYQYEEEYDACKNFTKVKNNSNKTNLNLNNININNNFLNKSINNNNKSNTLNKETNLDNNIIIETIENSNSSNKKNKSKSIDNNKQIKNNILPIKKQTYIKKYSVNLNNNTNKKTINSKTTLTSNNYLINNINSSILTSSYKKDSTIPSSYKTYKKFINSNFNYYNSNKNSNFFININPPFTLLKREKEKEALNNLIKSTDFNDIKPKEKNLTNLIKSTDFSQNNNGSTKINKTKTLKYNKSKSIEKYNKTNYNNENTHTILKKIYSTKFPNINNNTNNILKLMLFLNEYLINNNLLKDFYNPHNRAILENYSKFLVNNIKIDYPINNDIIQDKFVNKIKLIQRFWRRRKIKKYIKNNDENFELKKFIVNDYMIQSGYKSKKITGLFNKMVENFGNISAYDNDLNEMFYNIGKIINKNLANNEKNLLYKDYINKIIYNHNKY